MVTWEESNARTFEVLDHQHIVEKRCTQPQTGNLLYFATPAYFEAGWLPSVWHL